MRFILVQKGSMKQRKSENIIFIVIYLMYAAAVTHLRQFSLFGDVAGLSLRLSVLQFSLIYIEKNSMV
jgi:hypothetical protein